MENKILTLHPEGKKGARIDLEKYNTLRHFILDELSKVETIASQDLADIAYDNLQEDFDGRVIWYYVTVKLDLKARNLIKRVPKTSPHHLQLVQ